MQMFLVFLAILSMNGCLTGKQKSTNSKDGEEIRCVHIYTEFPIINKKGTVDTVLPAETKIYYYKDQVLYQFYTHHRELKNVEESYYVPYKYVYNSFVYSPGNKYGVFCKDTSLTSSRLVSADSVLEKEWVYTDDFISLFEQAYTQQLSSKWLSGDEKEEVYSFQAKDDTLKKGTFKLLFSKTRFADVPYSLSRSLDSLNGMKIIRIDITNNARDFPAYPDFHLVSVTTPYYLKECDVSNKGAILRLFMNAKRLVQ